MDRILGFVLVGTRAFPSRIALGTGQVPIGFPLDFLHGISPIGSRDRIRGANRKPGLRILFTQAIHIERKAMRELISSMYAR